MPFLFEYLLKFSLSLAVLYAFYYMVLRPLTFYQWNRFYLLCYSLLSFIIPFINITAWLPEETIGAVNFMDAIPAVESLASNTKLPGTTSGVFNAALAWNVTGLVFITGAVIMLLRMVYQYYSLLSMKDKAVLLNTGDVKFYDVNAQISPFSFANAIFINSRLHTEEEFRRILEHEFVHVKQKHTIDIVVAELICILNWFNPFAWLIRRAIRQNLEFIADSNVLDGGIDPRQYQYLLLKVMGLSKYRIASHFSISSLKKRITMMNKMKSARMHLVKFLFVLPLFVVMLLAFGNRMHFQKDGLMHTYAGIVVDAGNHRPVQNVRIKELNTGLEMKTDANGYFKVRVPVTTSKTLRVNVLQGNVLKKEFTVKWVDFQPEGSESFIGVVAINTGSPATATCDKCFVYSQQVTDKNGLFVDDVSYETVQKSVSNMLRSRADMKAIKNSDKPIIRRNDRLYILSGVFPGKSPGKEAADVQGLFTMVVANANNPVYLNGLPSSMEIINSSIPQFGIKQVDVLKKSDALSKYGKETDIIDITTYSGVGSDTIPRKRVAPAKAAVENIPVPPALPVAPAPGPAPIPATKKINSQVPALPPGPRPVIAPVEPVPPADTIPATSIRIQHDNEYGDPIYIVDGTILPARKGIEGIPGDSIKSIDVIKDATAAALYGDKAKYGVVSITTRNGKPSDDLISAIATKITVKNIEDLKELIIVDGIETTKENFSQVDPNTIHSISVLKGTSATALYNEKGKNGVIIVSTKPTL